MTTDVRDLFESLRPRLAALCREHRVSELALFGSALGDDFRETSDFDLLVEFEPEAEIGFLAMARLQSDLEDLLGRTVDLVPRSGLKPALRDQVIADARPLYAA